MLVKTNDNSGVKLALTINYRPSYHHLGVSLCSLQVSTNKKFRPGDLHRMAICGRRRWVHRRSGVHTRLNHNLAGLIKKDQTPISTRLYGCVYLESRVTGFMRLAVLSRQLL